MSKAVLAASCHVTRMQDKIKINSVFERQLEAEQIQLHKF